MSEKTVKMMIILTILFLTTGCYSNTPGSHSGIWVEESKSAQAPLNESQNESIVSAVSICTNPTKMVYKVGESINTDGLSLTISYSDGKKERVTSGFICSPQVLNSVGTQKIVSSYGGGSTSFYVTVQEKELASISINSLPNRTSYFVGDSIETIGLSLLAVYSNGETNIISSGFSCSPNILSTAGTQQITVSYSGKTAFFNVNVSEISLTSISIASQPNKTDYLMGEALDTTGLSLTAIYNDGSAKTVSSGFAVDQKVLNAEGETTITVSYGGKTATFLVTVTRSTEPSINIGDKLTFGPFKWIVLDKKGSAVLLLSKEAVTLAPYNNSLTDVTWETCTLRSWLNSSFLEYFTADEKEKILMTTVPNLDNPDHGTKGGNMTYDKVFLLSISEVTAYLPEASDRYCIYKERGRSSWTRSPGYESDYAAIIISPFYGIDEFGVHVNVNDLGVRPALWLSIDE